MSTVLIHTPTAPMRMNISTDCVPGAMTMHNLISKAHSRAIAKLVAGPAAATHSMSCLGWRNWPKFTGTGLAQPNRMPPRASVIMGSKTVPMGRCGAADSS